MVIINQITNLWMFFSVKSLSCWFLQISKVIKRIYVHTKKKLRFSHRFFAYMHLSKCEIFHPYEKSRKFFTFFSFLWSILLYEELKNVGSFSQVTGWSQNCVTGVVVKYLSQSQILKGIQEKNAVVPKYFFDGFQRL